MSDRRQDLGRRSGSRAGMTLIEVVITLVLLSGVLLYMGRYVGKFVHDTGIATAASAASDLATDKVETVKAYRNYSTLETVFNGSENVVVNNVTYTRVTLITRTVSTTTDYKSVTVTVSASLLATPIKKSTIIAAF
jgi:prepilin-type N-terminal cleavage/methylation domain-containing protein